MMTGNFVEIYKRRSLEVNADKSRVVLVLGGEDGSIYEVSVDGK